VNSTKNILFLGKYDNIIGKRFGRSKNSLLLCQEEVTLEFLRSSGVDEIVSYGYRHLLDKEIVSAFDGKIINLHISYLPHNRGASPNLWSIVENKQPGVTIHYIDEGIDTGDILCQRKVELDYSHDTLRTSYQKLINHVELLYLDMIHPLGKPWYPQKQKSKGTYHSIKQTNQLLKDLKLSSGWDTKIYEVAEKSIILGHRKE
jgi:methionyl-tRNA formyltransferase